MFRFAAVLCILVLSSVDAEVSDEVKENFRIIMEPIVKACMEELGFGADDLKEMKKNKDMDPCFAACVFKAIGTINGDGKFDYKPYMESAKAMIDDEKVLDDMRKIGEACMKVNDEDVKDDCGRANLMMQCFKDNKGYIHDL